MRSAISRSNKKILIINLLTLYYTNNVVNQLNIVDVKFLHKLIIRNRHQVIYELVISIVHVYGIKFVFHFIIEAYDSNLPIAFILLVINDCILIINLILVKDLLGTFFLKYFIII